MLTDIDNYDQETVHSSGLHTIVIDNGSGVGTFMHCLSFVSSAMEVWNASAMQTIKAGFVNDVGPSALIPTGSEHGTSCIKVWRVQLALVIQSARWLVL